MKILALDLAEYRIGWALGYAGERPLIDAYELRVKKEKTEQAVARFGAWLHKALYVVLDTGYPVELVAAENYLPHGALKGGTSAATRDGAILLNGALRGVCGMMGVHVECPAPASIRKHFCGRASGGDRVLTKAMVIKRAQLLGYIPKDCDDDDKADAAALFDYASSHFASKASAFRLTPNV